MSEVIIFYTSLFLVSFLGEFLGELLAIKIFKKKGAGENG
jgi:hypothetical protein